jgi:anti-sigma regulatory factor (Ser/Thr protein kinase)
MAEKKGDRIRRLILENIQRHPGDIVKAIGEETGLKKSAINYHLDKLVVDGKLQAKGRTRNKIYELVSLKKHVYRSKCSEITEHETYNAEFASYFSSLNEDVEYAWNHAITEMMNNVRDHSEGTKIEVELLEYATYSFVRVSDDGVGIFNKIKKDQNLNTHEDVVLELSKGGVTSDPDNHAGEGIFFTSKLIDMFCIYSAGDVYKPSKEKVKQELFENLSEKGTHVLMQHWNNSEKSYKDIFPVHTDVVDGEPKFLQTRIMVSNAMLGGRQLVSRSQAKRLTAGLEKFNKVILDFEGVNMVGQGFADQVFRVFAASQPDIEIICENTSKEVDAMIAHVTSS